MMDFQDAWNKVAINMAWGTKSRQTFYHMISGFLSDGVPMKEAINEIHLRWVKTKDSKKRVSDALLRDLRSGQRVGTSIARFSPALESMAIDAGDSAGDSAEGFRMALKLTKATSRIKSTIIGELFYPAFLLLILVLFLLALKAQVMPVFEEILPRDRWPAVASSLGSLADNVVAVLMGIFGIIIGIGVAYKMSRGVWVGELRDAFDKYIAPWKMNRRITGAVFLSCFSALSRMGVPFESMISKMMSTASPWEKRHLRIMLTRMKHGIPPAEALSSTLFEDEINWKISIYGKLSSFSSALETIADEVVEDVIKKIQVMMTIIRSLIMIMVAGTGCWVYASFFAVTMAAKSAV